MPKLTVTYESADSSTDNCEMCCMEQFYDRTVDMQHWFQLHNVCIKQISPEKYEILRNIFFDPAMLYWLQKADNNSTERLKHMQRLYEVATGLVNHHMKGRTNFFKDLPKRLTRQGPGHRPRIRLMTFTPGSFPPQPVEQ